MNFLYFFIFINIYSINFGSFDIINKFLNTNKDNLNKIAVIIIPCIIIKAVCKLNQVNNMFLKIKGIKKNIKNKRNINNDSSFDKYLFFKSFIALAAFFIFFRNLILNENFRTSTIKTKIFYLLLILFFNIDRAKIFSTIYKFSISLFSSLKKCRIRRHTTTDSFCIDCFYEQLSQRNFLTNNSEFEVNLLKFFYNLSPILQLSYNTFSITIKLYTWFKILENTEFNNNYKMPLMLFIVYILLEKSIYNAYFKTDENKKEKLGEEEKKFNNILEQAKKYNFEITINPLEKGDGKFIKDYIENYNSKEKYTININFLDETDNPALNLSCSTNKEKKEYIQKMNLAAIAFAFAGKDYFPLTSLCFYTLVRNHSLCLGENKGLGTHAACKNGNYALINDDIYSSPDFCFSEIKEILKKNKLNSEKLSDSEEDFKTFLDSQIKTFNIDKLPPIKSSEKQITCQITNNNINIKKNFFNTLIRKIDTQVIFIDSII